MMNMINLSDNSANCQLPIPILTCLFFFGLAEKSSFLYKFELSSY